ncbi:MAG: PQQ-binding-like beta-propeller repeat protein [Deltaproteobacteria bacterium]|nr:PQQ-binding-like beta-propeller repeat protein [Deltaproteobacteria bacterium]
MTDHDDDEAPRPFVSLPERWRRPLGEDGFGFLPPVVAHGDVFLRHGEALFRIRGRDGRIVWRHAFPKRSGLSGDSLLVIADLVITESKQPGGPAHSQKRAHTITAHHVADGSIAWKVDVVGQLLEGMITLHGGTLRVQTLKAREWKAVEIEVATGEASKPKKITAGLKHVTTTPLGLVGAAAHDKGKLRVPKKPWTEPLAIPGAWHLEVVGDALITLVAPLGKLQGVVEVRDLATMTLRWSAKCQGRSLAVDAERVLHTDKGKVVARSLATGEELWRTPSGSKDAEPRVVLAGAYAGAPDMGGGALFRSADGKKLGALDVNSLVPLGDLVVATSTDAIAAFGPKKG